MIIHSFSKTYGDRTVLRFPETEFEPGKIYAVVGANGSGKSTFARLAAGIEKPDGGRNPAPGIQVGYLPQKSYGFRMSVRKNLLLNGKDASRADRLMQELGILPLRTADASRLSGGETARMALCRLMMRSYDLVILDEPCASMDIESTLLSEQSIRNYCRETNCALIIITHSIQQARRLADEILFFCRGESLPLTDPKYAEFLHFYGE